MSDAWRTDARFRQAIVEPRGRAIAEVGAHRLVNRAEHLKQHEYDPHERERGREGLAALHATYEHAHRDGKHGGQRAAQDENHPPRPAEAASRSRQHREELPFRARIETTEHAHHCQRYPAACSSKSCA